MKYLREFPTGATRDSTEGKLEYAGFLHPLVLKRFAEYMHLHRVQKNGSVRDSDNWQKGIPVEVYEQSLMRHFMDVWLHLRGVGEHANEDYQTALCGLFFNTQGLLFEELTKTSIKELSGYEENSSSRNGVD